MKVITSNEFKEEVLNSDKKVLVDFYADWCGPCQMMGPVLEEIAEEVADTAKIVKVNVDDSADLAMEYEVMSIPTMLIFENGNIVLDSGGSLSSSQYMVALVRFESNLFNTTNKSNSSFFFGELNVQGLKMKKLNIKK